MLESLKGLTVSLRFRLVAAACFVLVLVLWVLLGGRTFCSWICPYHLLAEWAEKIHLFLAKKKLVTDHSATPATAMVVYWRLR